eukprot:Protomagalhaensia_wolfi_Nauph_80__1795@NODE_211_length_3168_cov_202_647811_g159_i0_p2_GENE_NODE_211_length_3168_cov_202_647811_g159_i0NODE_211_length_3168_cov_202_647811_g159_i0_p2_ORF_typecomplete_len273_score34_13Hydrolase_3/PF08282_12/7_8e47S6PP/PF05116_13/4_3e09Trehalose_PPase/PF02358_16/0_016Trehalose_PPase/PF02358_16/1_8HAD/PF12710_7/3_1e02HAD/PF12710_7/0_042Hydrolase_6/PF13344_6/0_033HAD_SAK_2/PF18143_1/0_34HAD_SAK_2/PF18143_1/1_3e03His_Phos_2/PF00328_22/0_15Hydrolase/PF00702_26/8_6e03Hyd
MKYIFTDIDGTILPYGAHEVPASCMETITRLKERKDIQVIFCTGRTLRSAQNVLKGLVPTDWFFPGIYSDGLLVYGAKGEILYERALDPAQADSLVADVREEFPKLKDILFSTRNGVCISHASETLVQFCHDWKEDPIIANTVKESMENSNSAVSHVMFLGQADELGELQPWLESRYGGVFRIFRVAEDMVAVMGKGWSKWEGIKKYIEDQGADLVSDVITIGDGNNDVEMLSGCAQSIAMGNGCVEAKEAAKRVTRDIWENGWAEGISAAL